MLRIMLRVIVLVLIAAGLFTATGGGQAGATVHPLSCAERSAVAPVDTPAQLQDPPGLTPGGPDKSRAEIAQPVVAVLGNSTTNDEDHAFKPQGC